jgi:hypothetical protein
MATNLIVRCPRCGQELVPGILFLGYPIHGYDLYIQDEPLEEIKKHEEKLCGE